MTHHVTIMYNERSLLLTGYKNFASLLLFVIFQVKITTQIQRQQKIKVSSVNHTRTAEILEFFYFTYSLFLTYKHFLQT